MAQTKDFRARTEPKQQHRKLKYAVQLLDAAALGYYTEPRKGEQPERTRTPLPAMDQTKVFEQIGNQAAETERHSKKHYWKKWLNAVELGPDFKPDIRSRPKRQAFLDAEKDMRYRIHKDKRTTKARDEMKEGTCMSLVEAIFWAPVEAENSDFTEEFIKATAIPFDKRTSRHHEIINTYWRSGLSLDPVLNFENSEMTQRQLESRLYGVTWSGSKKPPSKKELSRRRPKKPTNAAL